LSPLFERMQRKKWARSYSSFGSITIQKCFRKWRLQTWRIGCWYGFRVGSQKYVETNMGSQNDFYEQIGEEWVAGDCKHEGGRCFIIGQGVDSFG